MKTGTESAILFQPITDLEFSPRFKGNCKTMDFDTLADITRLLPQELRATAGFNYVWLGELIAFLNERKLLHLLQPLPGSNVY